MFNIVSSILRTVDWLWNENQRDRITKMNIQYLIVAILLAFAVMYAAWRIYRALRAANDPCYGCEGCQLKEIRDAQRKGKSGLSPFGKRQKAPCGEKK